MATIIPSIVERVLESITQIIQQLLGLRYKIRRRMGKRVNLIKFIGLYTLQPELLQFQLFDSERAVLTIRIGRQKLRIVKVVKNTRIVTIWVATVIQVGIIDRFFGLFRRDIHIIDDKFAQMKMTASVEAIYPNRQKYQDGDCCRHQ